MSIIKEKLTEKIHSNNINVHSLEKKAGLKIGSIRNILLGRSENPGVFTLLAACKALDCSLEEVLGLKKIQKPETIFCNVSWDFDLYVNIINEVNQWIEKNNVSITLEKAQAYINEIYLYSLNNNHRKLDQNFSNWILDKHK